MFVSMCEKVCAASGCKSPYSSVVEHPLSKRKVGSSILPGGNKPAFASRASISCLNENAACFVSADFAFSDWFLTRVCVSLHLLCLCPLRCHHLCHHSYLPCRVSCRIDVIAPLSVCLAFCISIDVELALVLLSVCRLRICIHAKVLR